MRIFSLLVTVGVLLSTLAALAADFSASVQTSTEPTILYHWFPAETVPKLKLQLKIKTSDPRVFNYISTITLSQWFSASPDPVALRPQGGNENWVLIELAAAPGFKTLDATPELTDASGCSELVLKTPGLSAECLKSLKDTANTLGLGAIRLKTGELILANGKIFQAADVRVFNRLSTEAPSERLKIQSLFYKADFARFKIGRGDSLFPSEISRLNPPFSGGGRGLLWDDLDGKPLLLDEPQH